MTFEWDEVKALANISKHGVAFSLARRIFDGPVLSGIDGRDEYGELREVSIGVADAVVVLVVVPTDRSGVTRIISARRATGTERKRYDKALQEGLIG